MPTPRSFLLLAVSTALAATALPACRTRSDRARDASRERVDDQVDSLARAAARLAVDTSAGASPVARATVPDRVGTAQATGATGDSVRIVSTDGAVVYTLARDTVRLQLSDSTVRTIRQKMDRDADTAGGGFGAFIKQTVAGAVGSAMRFVVRTPVRDIRSARYEDGELRIETGANGSSHSLVNTGSKQGGESGKFAPADARRFVAAIEARRRALGME